MSFKPVKEFVGVTVKHVQFRLQKELKSKVAEIAATNKSFFLNLSDDVIGRHCESGYFVFCFEV